ncbi:glycosyl hydrolase family 20, catalytic domain protein [Marvinbryantia formatexigens DSM 14469]|uniref:beta-N-acetylhexosaminidase n=1 Tax=Marvinbryantia formatexigens DSM 14469 TaxID=478749 RepID=C6L9L6_9FIRM|nr:glycoside hydrolase family 20 zincin-like fold domain-containing protein [Marvinbryantia formatexigens]EET62955.1 glycosyl hydrolase family 20, catalytic domain protein [Marvinbryantia formatexigens DSM 14469]UWO23535.1 family 20 glycosylhydrolase [Marvinbryantia formatexigens DSM 14469]SDG54970.1 Glycosyl hydrolase family 20, catalytic domain [Marvinbryantia formatexigens]
MDGHGAELFILPQPREWEQREGFFEMRYDQYLVLAEGTAPLAPESLEDLKEDMQRFLGFTLQVRRGSSRAGDMVLRQTEELREQEYTLEIGSEGILAQAGGRAGLLYAVQTLRQLIRQCGALLPCLHIHDYPAIPERGFYHDVTRGRIPTLDSLKKLASRMAFYKLNQMQIYIEHSFLFRDLSEVWRDDTPLTAEEILELDAFCGKLGIELVPSLASFGHLYKLLRTRQYAHLCELDNPAAEPFSFRARMDHHTINVSDSESLELMKKLIGEYMELFSSRRFNICADETFDLGKGKNRARAEEEGVSGMYTEFVRKLCEFVKERGRTPMFWGDIICGFPQEYRKLPEGTICLNWGYAPQQSAESTEKLYEAGAIQYLCPGVAGWNQWINKIEDSYENIRRMCGYAQQYHALGVLNTDWGDFGHINHPEFSIPGMIYGAAFSWNPQIPPFEEINRQISRMEYGDVTGEFVAVMAEADRYCDFTWEAAVSFLECKEEEREQVFREYTDATKLSRGQVREDNEKLHDLQKQLKKNLPAMDAGGRETAAACVLATDGIRIFNETGASLAAYYRREEPDAGKMAALAERLENWFYYYKKLWRSVSRESGLSQIQNVIDWYADLLRSFLFG